MVDIIRSTNFNASCLQQNEIENLQEKTKSREKQFIEEMSKLSYIFAKINADTAQN